MGPSAYTSPLLGSALGSLRATAHHHHSGTLLPGPGQASAMALQQAGLIGGGPAVGFGPVTNKFDNPPCNTLFIGVLAWTEGRLCLQGSILQHAWIGMELDGGMGLGEIAPVCRQVVCDELVMFYRVVQATWVTLWTRTS